MPKLVKMCISEISDSRKGLSALVGSPFRIKMIQDGREGLKCVFCKHSCSPLVSSNHNIHCSSCESLLYDGPNDVILNNSRTDK
jgi:hypothetical protein